jgi:predicted nucleic acid-binding protein
MVPAFFPERIQFRDNPLDLTRKARPLADAIRTRDVAAFAPGQLVYEFTKAAHRKTTEEGIPVEAATRQVTDFLYLWARGITTVPMSEIVELAWKLSTQNSIASPDSWYLATAMTYEAELWISRRDQRDRFGDHALEVYSQVFFLTERKFHQR